MSLADRTSSSVTTSGTGAPAPASAADVLPLDVPTAMRRRRTVRHYRPDPVPPALLDEVIDLALEAPSSWNLQDRSLVVVTGEEGLGGLARATGGQPQPQEAPVVVVLVAETQAWRRDRSHVHRAAEAAGAWSPEFSAMFAEASTAFQEALEARGALREYAVKDAMIAATYLMLAAESLGLASSPMNGWDEARVKEVVGIADRDDLAIALLVSLGYPAEARPHPGRQPRRLNVFRDRYGRPEA
jgi:nitroreductase